MSHPDVHSPDGAGPNGGGPDPELGVWVEAHRDELVAIRRHLHAHPELSGEEFATTELVAERLVVAGLEPRVLPGGTGLVCDLGPDRPGPRVGLRADLDALAMDDDKDVPYRSTRPGVAHACGHDVHTAVVLGAGLALQDLTGAGDPPPVRLVFQPAEERVPGGARELTEEGVMEGVGAIFALHCDPRVDTGRVGLRSGAITSATDMTEIVLHGPGGHTARPERSVDLVALAAEVVLHLPSSVSEQLGGRPVRITFGALHAGEAANVIPARADLRGTVRTPDPLVWDDVEPAIRSSLGSLIEPHGARFELCHTRGHPPVVNDPWATSVVEAAARAELGDGAVVATPQSVGGDDFSWYLTQAPGCYARLGVRDPHGDTPPLDLHASCFDVDEACIPAGVRLLVATVRRAAAALALDCS